MGLPTETRRIGGVSFPLVLVVQILSWCSSAKSQTYNSSMLVWEDNFDGNSLNETVWRLDTGNGCDQGAGLCGWGNFEKQTYTLNNHQVEDGVLIISAELEEVQIDERSYSSARLRTMSPVSFLTGRIEARIRLPSGQGLWAAFWMLPANQSRGDWAATGEIDIMEAVNDMKVIHGTIHYGGEYPANRFAGCRQDSGIDFSTDYHIYAIEWEQDEIRWYVDEQLYCTRTKWTSDLESNEPYRAPFDTEFELLLNLAVGGALPGRIVDDAIFPAHMRVDYIKVYDINLAEPKADPFLGVPACLPGIIEAESFDVGGLGLGYGDTIPEGNGTSYRADAIGRVWSASGRTFIGNMTEGDWTGYTLATDEASYDITLEVSSLENAAVQFLLGDDANCSIPDTGLIMTEALAIQATGAVSGDWGTVNAVGVSVPAGSHSVKLCVVGGVGTNVDRITFALSTDAGATASSSSLTFDGECANMGEGRPYMFGQPWAIPGYIEAEYYDFGGEGVGFHDVKDTENWGDSAIRPADGVDIIEAESNTAHGHYVGDLQSGEWLAFTARAEQGGFWDLVASVASGNEASENTFRILANATNCSSPDTDGLDGMGSAGVDLLNGPHTFGYTGSWEAFSQAGAEEVWVPAGDHRILFCADSEAFNLDYLRFYTPTPTPAPTPVPTRVPTMAPVVLDKTGDRFTWGYVLLGCFVGVMCVARLCFIIYKKEGSIRRKRSETNNCYDASGTADEHGSNPFDADKPPPTITEASGAAVARQGNSNGTNPAASHSKGKVYPSSSAGIELEMLPGGAGLLRSEPVSKKVSYGGSGGIGSGNGSSHRRPRHNLERSQEHPATGGTPSTGTELEMLPGGAGLLHSEPVSKNASYSGSSGGGSGSGSSHRHTRHNLERSQERPATGGTPPKLLPQVSSWSTVRRTGNMSDGRLESGAGLLVASRAARSRPLNASAAALPQDSWSHTPPKVQPAVSPVNNVLSGRFVSDAEPSSRRTPRGAVGAKVSAAGSLWDEATTSPLQPALAPAYARASPETHGAVEESKRDMFEDALLRAVEIRWKASRSSQSGELGPAMRIPAAGEGAMMGTSSSLSVRSMSFSEAPRSAKKSAMLAAGKCWTCQCTFENSAGQNSCLGCGRVAPVGRPRSKGLLVRQSSWVPPGGEL